MSRSRGNSTASNGGGKRARSGSLISDDGHGGGLGDIMGGGDLGETDMRQPITEFSPLQRVVLSANGNLQRLVSSYYNAPVSVNARRHEKTGPDEYVREVEISVFDVIFCVARSVVKITRPEISSAIENGVAIGQIFRHMSVLPTFSLHAAAFVEAGNPDPVLGDVPAFWREYSLEGDGVECHIEETLRNDLFDLKAPTSKPDGKASGGMFGDIMAPSVTGMDLPDGFTPKERLLLTANGNIERIISSYYAAPVTVYIMANHKRHDAPVWDRQVAMLIHGKQFMLAKTTIFLTKRDWVDAVEKNGVALGSLWRNKGVMPTFKLHAAGRGDGYFWRSYQLSSTGMTCEINETFSMDVFDRIKLSTAPKEDQLFFF